MQYFIVYKEYRNERPFDPSLLVIFRKRLPEETMCRIIEKMVIKADDDKKDKSSHTGGGSSETAESQKPAKHKTEGP